MRYFSKKFGKVLGVVIDVGYLTAQFSGASGLFSSGYTVTDRHISIRKSIVLRIDRGFEGVFESGLDSD